MSRNRMPWREAWKTYRRLMSYARPYWPRLVAGLVFGLLFGGSYFGMLGALRRNLEVIFDPAAIEWRRAVGAALLLPAVAVVMGIGNFFSKILVEWVGNRVVMDLRGQTFAHIHRLSLLYFTHSRTGELISRTTNDSMMVQRAVSGVVEDLVREPFVLLAAVSYLFWLDPLMSTVSLLLFPVCILPVAIFGRRVRRAAREGQQKLADLVSILQESITGARVVKAFGMEPYECGRFDERNRSLFSRLMRVARARAAVEPIIVSISALGLSAVLLYARRTGMGYEQFFTFGAALVMMYQPVKKLSRIHLQIQQSSAAADRLFEILDTAPEVVERPGARALEGELEEIAFEHAHFAYGKEPVLTDVCLRVRAGERVAFVGGSGAGKTTLVSLLPRFFDVTAGRLTVNGVDVRDWTVASLRSRIGIVTQETILFNDTVSRNIAYGRPDAPREAIEEAARQAHAHAFIEALEEGYETLIGERGVRLSGGQCQRLAIARAMLRNPPLLILDEATSALDTESERQVQAAIEALMKGRTVFMIAHRLSTIAHADRIVVLDGGRMVETGSHDELMRRGGVYRYLYDLQFTSPA